MPAPVPYGTYIAEFARSVARTSNCDVFISGTLPPVSRSVPDWKFNPDSTRTLNLRWTAPVFNSISNYRIHLTIKEPDGTSTTTIHYSAKRMLAFPSLPMDKEVGYAIFPISSAGGVPQTASQRCNRVGCFIGS